VKSKTTGGLNYEIFTSSNGKKIIADSSAVEIRAYALNDKDSLLPGSAANSKPVTVLISKSSLPQDFVDMFTAMTEGDSAVLYIPADTLKARMGGKMPTELGNSTELRQAFKIIKVMNKTEYADYMSKKQQDDYSQFQNQMNKDSIDLNTYFKEKNITPKKQMQVYYVIKKEGTGPTPTPGATVSVEYKGMLMNGEVFDQSKPGVPFSFPLGQGRVIPGWDIAMEKFNTGTEATIYIPSYLAYGPQAQPGNGSGSGIPANSNLIFEIKVLNVVPGPKSAPAPQQQPTR